MTKQPEDTAYRLGGLSQPEHPEQLARLGWQYFECPACGSEGARAFPKPEQWTPEDMAYRPGGLAQPEQEPVAWSTDIEFDDDTEIILPEEKGRLGTAGMTIPLYTSPPKRQPLTDKQIEAVYENASGQELRPQDYRIVLQFARAIEAKLKEKNA